MLEENTRMLRIARETRGLSYAEVEDATKVREYYLQLLEEGNIAKLPGRIYALGFAETYARFLGLSPEPILEDIKAFYASQAANEGFEAYVSGKKVVQAVGEGGSFNPGVKEQAESHLADKNTNSEEATKLRAAAYSNGALGRPIRTRKRRFGKRFLWLLLASLVVALLLVLYMLDGKEELPNIGAGDTPLLGTSEPAVENPTALGTETESDTGLATPETDTKSIQVVITALDEPVWVGVNVDDGDVSQVSLDVGQSHIILGENLVYLRFNNALHTKVEYNGKVLDGFSAGNAKWNLNLYPNRWEGFDDSAFQ